jgi:hypothetical protein
MRCSATDSILLTHISVKHYEILWIITTRQVPFVYSDFCISLTTKWKNENGRMSQMINDICAKHYSPTEHSAFENNVFHKFSLFKQLIPKKHKRFGIQITSYMKPRYTGLHRGKSRKCVAQDVYGQITSAVIWRSHTATINCHGTFCPKRKAMCTSYGEKQKLKQVDTEIMMGVTWQPWCGKRRQNENNYKHTLVTIRG